MLYWGEKIPEQTTQNLNSHLSEYLGARRGSSIWPTRSASHLTQDMFLSPIARQQAKLMATEFSVPAPCTTTLKTF